MAIIASGDVPAPNVKTADAVAAAGRCPVSSEAEPSLFLDPQPSPEVLGLAYESGLERLKIRSEFENAKRLSQPFQPLSISLVSDRIRSRHRLEAPLASAAGRPPLLAMKPRGTELVRVGARKSAE